MYAVLLGLEEVGATDSFFDLGGTSLTVMRLIRMMDDELDVEIGVAAVFLAPTPRQLAGLLRDKHGVEDGGIGVDGMFTCEQIDASDEKTTDRLRFVLCRASERSARDSVGVAEGGQYL